MSIISVSIIEDIEVIREDVVEFLNEEEHFQVTSEFGSVEDFLAAAKEESFEVPHCLLLDIGLPGMSGLEAIPYVIELCRDTNIIMLTSFEQQDIVLRALCSGAVAYISKKAELEEIADGLKTVYEGGSYMSPQIAREIVKHLVGGSTSKKSALLSERQSEIIERLAQGMSYGEIADQLFVSIETVRTHIKKMYRVLQVNNKAEAIAMYLRGEIG